MAAVSVGRWAASTAASPGSAAWGFDVWRREQPLEVRERTRIMQTPQRGHYFLASERQPHGVPDGLGLGGTTLLGQRAQLVRVHHQDLSYQPTHKTALATQFLANNTH